MRLGSPRHVATQWQRVYSRPPLFWNQLSGRHSMPILKTYGWRRDDYDPRDYHFESSRREFPRKVDLRKQFPAAYHQGRLESCCGNAIAAAIQFEQRRQELEDFLPSRLFIY